MAMTPEEKAAFERLEMTVQSLLSVENVPFIENGKRRIVEPFVGEIVRKDSVADTTGVLKTVSESGSGTYSVALEYDGTIVIEDKDGTTYKIGYYTP